MGYEKKSRKKKHGGALAPVPYDSVKNEQRWQAEDDLRALARAKACREDPERYKRACALAKEKLAESKAKAEEAAMLIKMGEGKMPEGGM